jgi:YesN/AraC family two-component response regulator
LRAFKLNSVDYLLKPIDDDLEQAVSKFKERLPARKQLDFEEIKMLANPFDKEYKKEIYGEKLVNILKVIAVDEIECFFYSENKGTYIHTLIIGIILLNRL